MSFTRLDAKSALRVVITGIAASIGVESTARDAHEDGFRVSLPLDAMTDPVPDSHEHSAAHIFPRIAETGTTTELLQLLGTSREEPSRAQC
jgi:nicotinamidase-related amidase